MVLQLCLSTVCASFQHFSFNIVCFFCLVPTGNSEFKPSLLHCALTQVLRRAWGSFVSARDRPSVHGAARHLSSAIRAGISASVRRVYAGETRS